MTATPISTSNHDQRPHQEHADLLYSSELEVAVDDASVPDTASLVARGPRGSHVPSAPRTEHERERAAISAAREARGDARAAAASSLSDQRPRQRQRVGIGSSRSSSATRTPIDAGASGREGSRTRAARATPQRMSSGGRSSPDAGTGGLRVTSAAQSTSSRTMRSRAGSVLAFASAASTHAVSEDHVPQLTLASVTQQRPNMITDE